MNKVIVLGGAGYHNSLGLARVFGINGIEPYGILTKASKHKLGNHCALSKYWKKVWLVEEEEKAISILLDNFTKEDEKPVLVPGSDGFAYLIDNNYDKLSEFFILPGINHKQGEVVKLMDKFQQVKWAKEAGINVADAQIIQLDEVTAKPITISFPLILKPVVSAEGDKRDIRKCEDQKSLKEELEELKKKGYKRILAQEFITKDYEIELFGAILKHADKTPFLLSKHYREWPIVGGTVCYHEFITDSSLRRYAEDILDKIKNVGYVGNIDIELFMVNGQLMLNEVNFRNSGDIYACFTNEVYYPYYSYLDMINSAPFSYNCNYSDKTTAMDEILDLRHMVYGSLSLKEWFKDWKRCADFSLYFKGDIKPALARYFCVIFKVFTRAKSEKQNYNQGR